MERSFSNTIGFQNGNSTTYVSEAVRNIENPVQSKEETRGLFSKNKQNTSEYIIRAINAYQMDGFIRIAVDRHSEMFKDFEFEGGQAQIKYLTQRLTIMSLRTGEHWKTTFSRYVHAYFQHGNPFLLKYRGNVDNAKRILYKDNPNPISGLFLISPTEVEPYVDGGTFYGWKATTVKTKKEYKSSKDGSLIGNLPKPPKKVDFEVLKNGLDVVHIPYKRPENSHFGWGITFSALDDINLLRNVEQTTAIGIKKNTIPLLWHKIIRGAGPFSDPSQEIKSALDAHRRATQDSVIVTPGSHELKVLGSESQTMRTESYLNYYAKRSFSGLGVSPFLMGFEPGTIGTAEAAIELLMNRIRFCQTELALGLEMFLINEILWEGGFDPYNKDSDQVRLVFKELDEARQTKLRSHFADLYTKNFVGLEEGRKSSGITIPPNTGDLYLNKVAIPMDKSKAGLKAKDKTKPTKKSVEKYFSEYFGRVRLDEFILEFRDRFDITLDELDHGIESLSHDPEAVLEYMYLVLDHKFKDSSNGEN